MTNHSFQSESDLSRHPFTEKLVNRHNKNLEFFKQSIPKLHQQIISSKAIPKITIDPISNSIQRIENNVVIYQPDPITFSMNETTQFLNFIKKIDYRPANLNPYLPHIIDKKAFKKTIRKFIDDRKKSEAKDNYILDLVIFGCGLGYHAEMLINSHRFRYIMIIENDMKKFKSTLYTLDWGNILTSLPNNKIVTFVINEDNKSEEKTNIFHHNIRTECIRLFPSGSLSTVKFTHLPDGEEHAEAKHVLREYANHFQVLYEKIGPDGQRLLNANENLRRGFKILNLKKSSIKTSKHVAVIGAGPSLDIYKDILIEKRKSFYIISAGTSLSSLLKIGIEPDLHLELEYKILLRDLLLHINNSFNLKSITLIPTIEVQPDVTHLFKNCYHFVPESSEIANTVNKDGVLYKAGINCVVSALMLANYLFEKEKNIYLFGIDFAYTNDRHHSEGNISMDKNLPKTIEKLSISETKYHSKSIYSVENTQGNKIKTTLVLNSSRMAMNDALKTLQRKIYNCSYGAKLENTEFINEEELIKKLKNLVDDNRQEIDFQLIESQYQSINASSISIIEKAINVSKKIHKVVNKHLSNEIDIPLTIFEIINEIEKFDNLYQRRTIYSVTRLPLYLLYLVSNFSSDQDRNSIIKQWNKDFLSYLKTVEKKVLYQLKSDNHTINEEWTDMKFV